jgi:Domain of Unknown Function (DUF1206)
VAAPALHDRSTVTDDWVERAGRLGLAARGVVYCVLGALAAALALGDRSEQTDHQGALVELAERPLGMALLVVLIVGFVAYAGWRIARAVRGEGGEEPNAGQRALDVAKAALYLGLAYTAVRLLTDDSSGSGGAGGGAAGGAGQDQAQSASARLMIEQSWGRWAVGLIGAVIAAYGVWQVIRGVSQKFREHLDETFGTAHDAVIRLGVVGHVARGVVFVVLGWLVVRAAVRFDPNQPLGIDAALREVLHAPYGPALALAVALGLAAYGLYSFGEAKYRQVS